MSREGGGSQLRNPLDTRDACNQERSHAQFADIQVLTFCEAKLVVPWFFSDKNWRG